MKYTQCRLARLRHDTDHARVDVQVNTAWIPTKFAVVGKTLLLKVDTDEWQDGWVVTNAYGQSDQPFHAYDKTRHEFGSIVHDD